MCGPPLFQLCTVCLLLNCHFLFVARVGLAVDFAVSFLVPPDGAKNGTVKVLSFVLLLSCAFGPKWDRQAVPFLGPCLGSFLKFFVSRLQKRNVLVQ